MKKITTKVLTIVAACAAMVFASCAQPSTSGSGAGGESKVELGLSSMDGWGKYEISDKSGTGFAMKSTAAQNENDCGGADITFGTAKKVTFTVKNNADEECWVQVIIKKDGADGSGSRIESAKLDGEAVTGDITWGVNTTIGAGASKDFELVLTGTDADKFVFSLNSNKDSVDLKKKSGNITVSNAYMYK